MLAIESAKATKEGTSPIFTELLSMLVLGVLLMISVLAALGAEDPLWASFIRISSAIGVLLLFALMIMRIVHSILDLRDRLKKESLSICSSVKRPLFIEPHFLSSL